MAESTVADARTDAFFKDHLAQSTECAMQLVRLGADLTPKINLKNALRSKTSDMFRHFGFDGKTALEIARTTSREELVELIERHLRYTPEERTEVVHCRCGSRLPWKECHGTGIDQPPHFHVHKKLGVMYRVAPFAKCPCKNTTTTYYECCWKDTAMPAYRNDANGDSLRIETYGKAPAVRVAIQQAQKRAEERHATVPDGLDENSHSAIAAEIRASPETFQWRVGLDSPNSQLGTWDPLVYAGCLDRLDDGFLWKDTHWKLDKTVLLRRVEEWNRALQKYCDDEGLVGEERERVVAKHTANPCTPCGRVGCDAFEKEVREFQRCSRCKAIAYCGRECQKLDWPGHRPFCI
jgi:MYND finger